MLVGCLLAQDRILGRSPLLTTLPQKFKSLPRGTAFMRAHECPLQNTVTKVYLWVYGVNTPTRRIMENEGLFTNMQENTWYRYRKQYFLHRLATQTDNNSQIITVQHFDI
ncbi:hypothetical protein AVEN_13247-1 [Araneus ventricosus]|uniref:Uncharacterized protein n=1 Tax=Araneus ventricosus TaxID=182803 RepID=A0A4Y2DKU6_ARAVE|nr:hypothetical protein AVEN_13247-1 [Araneus ventricosus]